MVFQRFSKTGIKKFCSGSKLGM